MNSRNAEKRGLVMCLLVCLSIFGAQKAKAQESTFDWLASTDESVRLDPAGLHTGRMFKPTQDAGNVHVDIEAQAPITVEMASAGQWSEAMRHPELLPRITFRCVREHITTATYICDVPAGRPMILVLQDERNSDQTAVSAFAAPLSEHGTQREFVSPNDIHIQYYRWACVENCNPPRYEWVKELKESYELTSTLKVYDGIIPERDGEPFSIKVDSPAPLTVALVPSGLAEHLQDKPENIETALNGRPCVEKDVRSASFECTFDLADGPQSFVAVPSSASNLAPNKKAAVEVVASKCVVNCLTDIDK